MKYHLLKTDQKPLYKTPRTQPRNPIGLPKVCIYLLNSNFSESLTKSNALKNIIVIGTLGGIKIDTLSKVFKIQLRFNNKGNICLKH